MTRMILTLEPGADSNILKSLFENIKGIGSIKIENYEKNESEKEKKLRLINELAGSLDPSIIDWNDERTQYIMKR
ncbi:MAG: hypothetical protein J1F67_03230 [Muribaculaceae bacterium]|nr:hypothetical protein [Muribaculaceae bacterium]